MQFHEDDDANRIYLNEFIVSVWKLKQQSFRSQPTRMSHRFPRKSCAYRCRSDSGEKWVRLDLQLSDRSGNHFLLSDCGFISNFCYKWSQTLAAVEMTADQRRTNFLRIYYWWLDIDCLCVRSRARLWWMLTQDAATEFKSCQVASIDTRVGKGNCTFPVCQVLIFHQFVDDVNRWNDRHADWRNF